MAALEVLALNTSTPQIEAPQSGDTYSFPRAVTGSVTFAGSTVTASSPVLDMAQTWNNVAVTFTGLKINVTDTTSAAASLLMDLQVGGTSQFKVLKTGIADAVAGYRVNGVTVLSGSTLTLSADAILIRDAANTLAQRNGTNAQTSRVYGTFTNASNGRWLNIAVTTAGVCSIAATGNGTGASGNVLHISSLPTSNPGPGILWNNAGTPAIGT